MKRLTPSTVGVLKPGLLSSIGKLIIAAEAGADWQHTSSNATFNVGHNTINRTANTSFGGPNFNDKDINAGDGGVRISLSASLLSEMKSNERDPDVS